MANWLQFERLKEWPFALFSGFQYDQVSDEQITTALGDARLLGFVDTSKDWEDDHWLRNCPDIPEERKHAYRIAGLVRDFRAGQLMSRAIHLDTFTAPYCGCCVCDGHHRIRALQYLGFLSGPFALSGLLLPLEDLVALAGCEAPREASRYCSTSLLTTGADDVSSPIRPEASKAAGWVDVQMGLGLN